MSDEKADFETIRRAFSVFNGFDGPDSDELWWRTDDDYAPITLITNCNDLFAWGCADCEVIGPSDIEDLERAYADCRQLDEGDHEGVECAGYCHLLWVARKRGVRPQWAYYRHFPDRMHHLFNAVSDEPGYGWPPEAERVRG